LKGAGSDDRPFSFGNRQLDNPAHFVASRYVTSPDLDLAAAQSQAAITAGTGDAYDHAIVALALSAQGDFARADTLFQRALELEPGNPSTLTSLAIHYRNQSRFRDAVLACDEAIRHYPDYPDAWLERGAILASGGSNEGARASFSKAAELAPQHPAAYAGLAALAAREGRHEDARHQAVVALKLDPQNAVATNALASAELAEGRPDAARDLLEPLVARLNVASLERSLAYSTLAGAYDKQSEHAAAFAHYERANADFVAIHEGVGADHLDNTSFVEAIAEGLAATPVDAWRTPIAAQPANAAVRHIFLIGYPRSGTTLVENILASLAGVSALEERPTLAMTDQAYIGGNRDGIIEGIRGFAALDTDGLDQHRQAYWDKVVAAGVPASAPCFVDMDPLKGTRLPFIARLFPDARILVMRRDPRDVVWSCFRTNFAMSSGTLEYTSLIRAARHYDALMRLTELALERLPVQYHIVQYHKIVQDFEAESAAMCAFARLEWNETVRDFDRTAKRRGVTTASAGQVHRGLYDGTKQWQPYAKFLEPVLPILQPWIDKFGYTEL
jgi:Flp pilus assembly protein TadD